MGEVGSGVEALVRRFATASALAAIAVATGCAALAEEGWSLPDELEPVEAVASPTIPEASEPAEVASPPEVDDGCITDPIADAVVHWPAVHRDTVTAEDLAIWPLPDVDGDGREESMAVAEVYCGVMGNCPRLLYLSNDGCPRYGGGFWAAWESERVLPKTRGGVHDLEVYLKSGCAGTAGTVFRLGWTGKSYRVRSTIDCECPAGWSMDEPEGEASEPAESARHPACPG